VTEAEWLASENPLESLAFVAPQSTDRKVRLFLCHCCARVVDTFPPEYRHFRGRLEPYQQIQGALNVVEQFAEGLVGSDALVKARWAAEDSTNVNHIDYGGEVKFGPVATLVAAAAADRPVPKRVLGLCREGAEEDRWQIQILRDIFGNPFRPVVSSPEWRTDTVLSLARQMYELREFSATPILADALQDAGCDNDDILNHCRGDGLHVRGCWVLDLFIEPPPPLAVTAAPSEPEDTDLPPPAPARPQLRPGDWLCRGCNAHNFARRDICLRCERARPEPKLREGDWICRGCNAHNFARRQHCHQCRGTRPR
jgi:hypothetical protein